MVKEEEGEIEVFPVKDYHVVFIPDRYFE